MESFQDWESDTSAWENQQLEPGAKKKINIEKLTKNARTF
jgi:hypothetical protein